MIISARILDIMPTIMFTMLNWQNIISNFFRYTSNGKYVCVSLVYCRSKSTILLKSLDMASAISCARIPAIKILTSFDVILINPQ